MADRGTQDKDPGAIRPHAHMDEVSGARGTPPERRAGPGEAAGPDRRIATVVPLETRSRRLSGPGGEPVPERHRDPADIRAGPGDAGRQNAPGRLPDTGRRRSGRRAILLAVMLLVAGALVSALFGLAAG